MPRLIDDNALGIGRCDPDLFPIQNRAYCAGWNGVVNIIEQAPTVDAVEVVHGRWIRKGNEMKCSKCKFIYYSNHDDFNYCPNCGAKMDGDGNG